MILDLYSRRIIGWACAVNLTAEDTVLAALRMAQRDRRPPHGLLFHSDRGIQFACTQHRALLLAAGAVPSMSRPGNPYDKSWMATYKRECVASPKPTAATPPAPLPPQTLRLRRDLLQSRAAPQRTRLSIPGGLREPKQLAK